jgi:hypothetical protein
VPKLSGSQEERSIILLRPEKRPYGVKVHFHVLTAGVLGNVEEVCVSLGTGAFLTIAPRRKAPWEGGRKFVITLEGFARVCKWNCVNGQGNRRMKIPWPSIRS